MNDLGKFLVDQGGLWGVIAVVLAMACMYLERSRQELQKLHAASLAEVQKQRDAEHAARLADAKENTRAMLDIAERTHEALERLAHLSPPKR
jgi:hypothetical protein